MYVIKDNELRISVRSLVEFIYRGGDIDNTQGSVRDIKLMQEGARLHRKIQKSMGAVYNAEVPLKIAIPISSLDYVIRLEGRADGIICDLAENMEGEKSPLSHVTIDEIKTLQRDVTEMKEPVLVHEAQARCYAYIYAKEKQLADISIQMTYVDANTEAIKRFVRRYSFEELEKWFNNTINSFIRWSDFLFEQRIKRAQSIKSLEFPFPYRKGQKNLAASVYRAIENESNLYIQAPTGTGKTMAVLFPAIAAVGQGFVEKIFYLTSKTITRTVANDAFEILRSNGLYFRTVTLTAKDKICSLEERNCNPIACERAKGHFDRVNDAVYDLITHEYVIDRDKIEEYAAKYLVCPFEMSLDVSLWCDGIICDYNYVFDPNVALKRYFADGGKGDFVFLVDEAHNLVERARQMYSASLVKEEILSVKRLFKDKEKKLYSALEACNKDMLSLKRECDSVKVVESLGHLLISLERAFSFFNKFLEKNRQYDNMDDILDFYFKLRNFLQIYDLLDDKYVKYLQYRQNGDFEVKLFCVDPSGNISECLGRGISTIFFSATLLPINYYKDMLSGDRSDNAVYALSSFEPDNKRVVIAKDVSSRYTRRNEYEFRKICSYIKGLTDLKTGNYLVFFPSYSYMESVKELFLQYDGAKEINYNEPDSEESEDDLIKYEVITQTNNMSEIMKERFLNTFIKNTANTQSCRIGFCVSGGVFSEGIDLKEESLIGAVIVGTGLPMISTQRNILRSYFDEYGKDGYAYAYVYPGMNKVLQAAGRVIRTEKDRGIILLLDDRFLTAKYEELYPREWDTVYKVNRDTFNKVITDFWKNSAD